MYSAPSLVSNNSTAVYEVLFWNSFRQICPSSVKQTTSLTAIFNVSLTTGELPRAFKVANIAPVYKSGDHEEAGNYRPISLLPIVSKVLEKIVSAQLKQFIQRNNLLPDTQFAYRANHSTEDALTYAVNQLLLARDQGKVTGFRLMETKTWLVQKTRLLFLLWP